MAEGENRRQVRRTAYRIRIDGIVQGVGFRPFIYRLAVSKGLKGRVLNSGAGVVIEAEGTEERLEELIAEIPLKAPPLSAIRSLTCERLKPAPRLDGFVIDPSSEEDQRGVFIPPDVSVCEDCARELYEPGHRLYLYPFINCTNCGPRFTIIENTPYDRVNTTMKIFPMCASCAEEYHNPGNRRYHAQPLSCRKCGPTLRLLDCRGRDTGAAEPLEEAAGLLAGGAILAVKGLGGYHLACDAFNRQAVLELRRRKHRDEKPFAVMARDMDAVRKYCVVGEAEEKLLTGERKPVVLLRKRAGAAIPVESEPANPYLGVMLPYTPVHLLLFSRPGLKEKNGDNERLELLVMTSGNISSEPICFKEKEAFARLGGIADFFLVHDREIRTGVDDSVTRVFMGNEYILRRSRGYAPSPLRVRVSPGDAGRVSCVLGVGAELKNTFCLSGNEEFYLSQHVGDLENLETLEAFERSIEHLKNMLRLSPSAVAYDLHPDYLSTRYALGLENLQKLPIQHHHAHLASCMAENGIRGEAIGVIFDGTGYGSDGKLWGGEFLAGGYGGMKRLGHLAYVGMPGGEAAIKAPWRMAAAYAEAAYPGTLTRAEGREGLCLDGLALFRGIPAEHIRTVGLMLEKDLNCPETSGMGRLFDAVSSLLGLRNTVTYEGQAAAELEYASRGGSSRAYSVALDDGAPFTVDTGEIIRGIIEDMKKDVPKGIIGAKFHNAIACLVRLGCERARELTGFRRVVLSGGVFQNLTLLELCLGRLRDGGFDTYIHSAVPPNDGGIALGQAAVAAYGLLTGQAELEGQCGG